MTQLLAHRGASHLAPENTLSAFRLARDLAVDGFECDVRLCKSGEWVLFHDETLERTTDFLEIAKRENFGSKRLRDLTLEQLRRLDAGKWKDRKFQGEKIPLLEEILQWVKPEEFLIIEVKIRQIFPDGSEKALLHLLKKFPKVSNVLIGSFNPYFLWRFKRLSHDYSVGLISDHKPPFFRQRNFWLKALKPRSLVLEDFPGNEVEILKSHQENRKVFLWTLDSREQIQAGIKKGADAVISNCAELFREIRTQF